MPHSHKPDSQTARIHVLQDLLVFFKSANTLSRKNCPEISCPLATVYKVVALPLVALYTMQAGSLNSTLSKYGFPIQMLGDVSIGCKLLTLNRYKTLHHKYTHVHNIMVSGHHSNMFLSISLNSEVSIKNLAGSIFCTNIVLHAHIKLLSHWILNNSHYFFVFFLLYV